MPTPNQRTSRRSTNPIATQANILFLLRVLGAASAVVDGITSDALLISETSLCYMELKQGWFFAFRSAKLAPVMAPANSLLPPQSHSTK